MKLSELKEVVDAACERAGNRLIADVDVFVSIGKKVYTVRSVSQFNIIPELYIEVGQKEYDGED